jgi:hypothetical protein
MITKVHYSDLLNQYVIGVTAVNTDLNSLAIMHENGDGKFIFDVMNSPT